MTVINVSMVAIVIVLVLAEGWVHDFRVWVATKVMEQ